MITRSAQAAVIAVGHITNQDLSIHLEFPEQLAQLFDHLLEIMVSLLGHVGSRGYQAFKAIEIMHFRMMELGMVIARWVESFLGVFS
jgi:hypothetical protein